MQVGRTNSVKWKNLTKVYYGKDHFLFLQGMLVTTNFKYFVLFADHDMSQLIMCR